MKVLQLLLTLKMGGQNKSTSPMAETEINKRRHAYTFIIPKFTIEAMVIAVANRQSTTSYQLYHHKCHHRRTSLSFTNYSLFCIDVKLYNENSLNNSGTVTINITTLEILNNFLNKNSYQFWGEELIQCWSYHKTMI